MKSKLFGGIIIGALALVALAGIIFCHATHHFFSFLTMGGLSYAIITEALTESKNK